MNAPGVDRGDDGAPLAQGGEAEALVLFCDAADRWWQRLLKPGFRHCLVLVRIGAHWLACDSLWHGVEFHLLPARKWNPAAFFGQRGFTVVRVRRRQNSARRPIFVPFTCVELACRVLGIPGRLILTPWQLYKNLIFLSYEKKH